MSDILLNTTGYTLIEMLVAIAVLGLVIVPLMMFFSANYTAFLYESAVIEAQQIGRMGLDHIITNMRKAEQSTIEIADHKEIRMVIGGRNYRYYLSGGIVYQEIGATPNQLMHNVKTFRVIDNEGIIKIEVAMNIGDGFDRELEYSTFYRIKY